MLEKIIKLVTEEGDTVLDLFCGSGTTLVAAKLLERNAIGIDLSVEAVEITRNRLKDPVMTESKLLKTGREAYRNISEEILQQLGGLDIVPVQRNNGIDALLKLEYRGGPVPIRIQRPRETLTEAINALYKAARTKGAVAMIVISTHEELNLGLEIPLPTGIIVIDSTARAIEKVIQQLENKQFT